METNLNSGQSAISREQCEDRFTQIINLEFEKEMWKTELAIKQTSFDSYFEEEKEIEVQH